VSDLLNSNDWGWQIPNGDVDAAEAMLRHIASLTSVELAAKGRRARELMTGALSKRQLCGRFCDRIDAIYGLRSRPNAAPARELN
jgi:hypothetical protein